MSDEAVSDVVGSILLVGITVGMTVVLALLLFAYDGPEPETRAHLAISVLPGLDGAWGTKDEQVVVRHLGGDPIRSSAHVLTSIGGVRSDLSGAALGPASADGRLVVGEMWTQGAWIKDTDVVIVEVVDAGGELSRLLASATMMAGGVA
jgi:FlaG/FlaF family flagellin (archaellin)